MTKPMLPLIGICLLVGACSTSLDTFYRPGGTVSRLETDMLNCEVQALADAPVANEVRQTPSFYVPGNFYCTSRYYCHGGWSGGEIYTVDVNKDLRTRVTNQCMAEKGYSRVSIPRCSDIVAAQVPERTTTVMPNLSPGSCVVRNSDGTYQLVQAIPAGTP
ncbi:MAG: hypothetical protein AAGA05_10165 [Pseudomonadota bacterium]